MLKETHTDMQATIEGIVTNGVRWYDCEYVDRGSKVPENDLSLQIHLGLLKRETAGLTRTETSVLNGLEFMQDETFALGIGEFLQFGGLEDVEAALNIFVERNREKFRRLHPDVLSCVPIYPSARTA